MALSSSPRGRAARSHGGSHHASSTPLPTLRPPSPLGVRVVNDVLGTLVEEGTLGRGPDETPKADPEVEAHCDQTAPGGG